MKLTIEINGDNAAFESGTEFARILLKVVEKISWQSVEFRRLLESRGKLDAKTDPEHIQFPLRDVNGNTVGFCKLEEQDEDSD